MRALDQIAEQQIIAARERGEFDNLPGQGKPMVLDDDSAVPADQRASLRVLKNSGYVPAELEQLKELRQLETVLAATQSDDEKKQLLLKLSLLRSRLPALTLTASGAQQYHDRLLRRLVK